MGGNTGTTAGFWIQPLEGEARPLPLGDLVVTGGGGGGYGISVARAGAIALTATTSTRPSELYFMASATATPRRLTNLNAEVVAFALGRTEAITWSGPDGFTEDGVVTHPPDFDPGRKYPLVLNVHGGPRQASTTSFDPVAQAMASDGWIVFQPNYRGSDNLGNRYMAAIVNDAGKGPGQDVMVGVAELRKRPYVDRTRTAVTGWSYGGFMTAWLIGNYPGEWQAAVAGAPVTNWEDTYYHVCRAGAHADAHHVLDPRFPRPAHAGIRAVPGAAGQWRGDEVRRVSGERALPGEPGDLAGHILPLDRVGARSPRRECGGRGAARQRPGQRNLHYRPDQAEISRSSYIVKGI